LRGWVVVVVLVVPGSVLEVLGMSWMRMGAAAARLGWD
jgi:hypothetical protein